MKIGIIQNRIKENCEIYVDKIVRAIERHGGIAVVADCDGDLASAYDGSDIVISVGGDGTFLSAAASAVEKDIPVLGFNLGTLGLLTEFEKDDIDSKIAKIASGDYDIEQRRVIDVYTVDKNGHDKFLGSAINDCVYTRDPLSAIAYVNLYINDVFVDMYPCDGFIVATQTGSTAYSMSAGGPIVEPGNDVNIITSICPHTLFARSFVAKPTSTVRLELCREHEGMHVILDSRSSHTICGSDTIECRGSDKNLKIVRIDPPNFYTALRSKFTDRNGKVSGV